MLMDRNNILLVWT